MMHDHCSRCCFEHKPTSDKVAAVIATVVVVFLQAALIQVAWSILSDKFGFPGISYSEAACLAFAVQVMRGGRV